MKHQLHMEIAARRKAEERCEQAVAERAAAELRAEHAEAEHAALQDEYRSWTAAAAAELVDPASQHLSLFESALPFGCVPRPDEQDMDAAGDALHPEGKGKRVIRELGERTQDLLDRAAGE